MTDKPQELSPAIILDIFRLLASKYNVSFLDAIFSLCSAANLIAGMKASEDADGVLPKWMTRTVTMHEKHPDAGPLPAEMNEALQKLESSLADVLVKNGCMKLPTDNSPQQPPKGY
jgi:hypothetical protein